MSETLSRADKTQTAIVYDLHLDPDHEQLERLEVTVLCAMRDEGAGVGPQGDPNALSDKEHVAFKTTYRFSDRGGVERFPVPRAAARLLR